jgi:hypothetical protein
MTGTVDPDAIDADFVATQHAAVTGVEIDGEAVLYHADAGTVHVLNPTATLLWKCLDGELDLGGLAADVADVFEADLATVLADVLDTVRAFGRQGLLDSVTSDEEVVAERRLAVEVGPLPPDPPAPDDA